MFKTLYRTILLIDDDVEDQEIFIDAIKEVDPDILCLCWNDGEEAVRKLSGNETDKPDLIFLDLNMPKLNGKEVLKRLKRIEMVKDIPVIMFSTFFGNDDIQEFNASGAIHYIVKSTSFLDLCRTLKEALSKKW